MKNPLFALVLFPILSTAASAASLSFSQLQSQAAAHSIEMPRLVAPIAPSPVATEKSPLSAPVRGLYESDWAYTEESQALAAAEIFKQNLVKAGYAVPYVTSFKPEAFGGKYYGFRVFYDAKEGYEFREVSSFSSGLWASQEEADEAYNRWMEKEKNQDKDLQIVFVLSIERPDFVPTRRMFRVEYTFKLKKLK